MEKERVTAQSLVLLMIRAFQNTNSLPVRPFPTGIPARPLEQALVGIAEIGGTAGARPTEINCSLA